ncbi:MAG: enoyl-CoA hydratase [Reyranella sp.]|uniref:enoyl-CoA hydratase n=1 Tax=Reyranella sp. TaxID=1929291 RepID=UPI003D13BF6E
MNETYRTILVERATAGYAVVTLNRPEKLNALSIELRTELISAIDALQTDPAIRVLILTGAGRAFTAGLDLHKWGESRNSAGGFELDVTAALARFEGPVIGAINGPAVTGGFEISMACDVLIASTAASFCDTHVKMGLLPGWGISVRLPRRIGLSRAKELALTARVISATEAAAWGIVNTVVPPEELVPHARALAEQMLAGVPETLVVYKRLIDAGYELPMGEALASERKTARANNGRVGHDAIASRWAGGRTSLES